jgi:hypothetical protein
MDACTGQSDVHSRPFAFRQPAEDDESVKMSKITSGRSSALSPALRASRPLQNRQFLFIQINHFPILQLIQNKTLHFSYSMQMSAFLAPRILQFAQNKLLRHRSPPFFYSLQMNGHQSPLTNH